MELVTIGGHPRSGTTSLRVILNEHPNIWCTNELSLKGVYPQFIKTLTVASERAREIGVQRRFNPRRTRFIAESWFALSKFEEDRARFEQARIIANKTPGAEAFFLNYANVYPRMKFIYCLRDPLKVVRSNLNMRWSGGSFDYALKRLRRGYNTFLKAHAEMPDRIHLFRIETFAEAPQQEAEALCEFLGCDKSFAERMARAEKANTLERKMPKEQQRNLSADEVEAIMSDALITRMREQFL